MYELTREAQNDNCLFFLILQKLQGFDISEIDVFS